MSEIIWIVRAVVQDHDAVESWVAAWYAERADAEKHAADAYAEWERIEEELRRSPSFLYHSGVSETMLRTTLDPFRPSWPLRPVPYIVEPVELGKWKPWLASVLNLREPVGCLVHFMSLLRGEGCSSDEQLDAALEPYAEQVRAVTATRERSRAIRFRIADVLLRQAVPAHLERSGNAADAERLRILPAISNARTAMEAYHGTAPSGHQIEPSRLSVAGDPILAAALAVSQADLCIVPSDVSALPSEHGGPRPDCFVPYVVSCVRMIGAVEWAPRMIKEALKLCGPAHQNGKDGA